MASTINIAKLNAIVTANATQFVSELGKAKKAARDFGNTKDILGAVGTGLSIAGIVAFAKSVLDLGGKLTDLSSASGLTVEELQLIGSLGADAGVGLEEIAKGSENMRSKLEDAVKNGADPLNASLAKLHLTSQGLQTLKQGEAWQVLGQRLSEASDKQEAMNVISQVFGEKLGPKLRSTLLELANGYAHARDIAKDGLIPGEDIKRLDTFGDKLGELGRNVKKFGSDAINGLLLVFEKARPKANAFWQNLLLSDNLTKDFADSGHLSIMDKGPNFLKTTPDREKFRGQFNFSNGAGRNKGLEDKMASAKPDFFADLEAEKAKKGEINKYLDLFFGDMDEQSKLSHFAKPDLGVDTVPKDAFARIGLMTGPVAVPEQKKHTELLTKVHHELQLINSNIKKTGAAFTE